MTKFTIGDLNKSTRWQITATLKLGDGTQRVEDLGIYEASVGHKAKSAAITRHAGRLGLKSGRRGISPGKWTFKIALADKPVEPPTPVEEPTPIDENVNDDWPAVGNEPEVEDDGDILIVDKDDPDAGLNEEALYFAEIALSRVLYRLRSHTLRGAQLERMKLIEQAVNCVSASRLK